MTRAANRQPLGKPVQRLWLQSMTPQAIRDGFERLRSDAQMQGLADAARSRSEADWLVGINGTRAMTAFNSQRRWLLPDHRGPRADAHAGRGGRARGADPPARGARLLGSARHLPGRGRPVRPASGSTRPGRRATTPTRAPTACGTSAGAGHRRGRARPALPRCARKASPAPRRQPAAVRPDQPAARGQRQVRLLGQDHAVAGPEPVRAPQGADLPANRLAPPARGLPGRGAPDLRDAGRRPPAAPGAARPHGAGRKGYVKPIQAHLRQRQGVSDHFAIIPTLQEPGQLSEAERKLYDLVVRRFMAVFFPSAEYQVTTRITTAEPRGQAPTTSRATARCWSMPGWLAIYGKEAADESGRRQGRQVAGAVAPGRARCAPSPCRDQGPADHARPARYSEATLLGAMEGAGKWIEDDELREAMQEKGLGTPATRAAIIEGLLNEKYMLREGRELIPTAKAFQLMTLLRGLEVEELSQARADRRVGIQAGADGARPALARDLHARDRRHDRAHRGARPRNTTATPCPATTPPCTRPARTAAAW
jgi:DNA topoisomerase-3